MAVVSMALGGTDPNGTRFSPKAFRMPSKPTTVKSPPDEQDEGAHQRRHEQAQDQPEESSDER
jgi:hypothetical protein